MRQSRIYTPQILQVSESIKLTGQSCHYLARVLRLSTGDPVILFNGDGHDYAGEIQEVQRQHVLISLTGSQLVLNESPLKITLVQAISKGERMDHSLQKATELGVHCIQPVTSQRVEVRLGGPRLAKRLAHWQGVVVSACEQSGRAIVPEVKAPVALAEWLTAMGGSPCLVLDPKAESRLSRLELASETVSVLVGPEGGFSEEETAQLQHAGVGAVSIGPRILRTETAGPAAIAIFQALQGDI